METSKMVSFSCAGRNGALKVLTDGNSVYDAITLTNLKGVLIADELLEALRMPLIFGDLCAKMEEHGYKLVGNTYVFQK